MLRKYSMYVTLVVVLFSFFITSNAAAAEQIAVSVNQSQVMNFFGVEKVAIASPEIADVVVVSSSEVLLVGKAPGTTTLHIWSAGKRESFQIEVSADDTPIANEIKRNIGLDTIKVSKIGKNIILEGTVDNQYKKNKAEKIAAAYGEKVVNLLELTRPVQVRIEAVIAEIDREKSKDLGIKWGTDAVSAPGLFTFGQSASNSFVTGSVLGGLNKYNPINGQLSAMVKNGSAKILSKPNMITLSGEKASIVIGGQIPIPASYQNGQITIEWKEYGIKLDIAPEVSADGLINSKVKAEVSSLDWNSTHKIQLGTNVYIPPIKVNKAEAVIALSSGQTMAIGGLISNQTSKDITKIPLLGDLPILGQLFTSVSYSRGETEIVILITSTIIDPAEYLPGVTTEMNKFLKEDPMGGNVNGGKNKDSDR